MNDYQSKKLMVLDTEYDNNPKRLLALAYIIYTWDGEWKKDKTLQYVKHDSDVFSVDESGAAFEVHQLSNEFLDENGINIRDVLEKFYEKADGVDIIIGQNIVNADIQAIRKEAIGENLWFGKIENKIKKSKIYDTKVSFKNKNIDEKCSLNNIYQFLFQKEMKNHHNALYDCKNTFKCFEKMIELGYVFNNEEIKFGEDIFLEITKELPKCDICDVKIPDDSNRYIFKNNEFIEENDKLTIGYKYKLIEAKDSQGESIYKKDNQLCSKCVSYLEILVTNNNVMVDLIKMKLYGHIFDKFFNRIGPEKIVYLKSSYKDKDEIKRLGGKWDGIKKSWFFSYTPKTSNKVEKFRKWLPVINEVD